VPAAPGGAGLTVAVTGPTGEIGKPFVAALERSPEVARIVGMARRPFDPAEHGWRRTEYVQGDVLDRAAVDRLVAGADVVVHLAFIVVRASSSTRDINVEGSRNVFRATVGAGAKRLVYASSVAAYGFPEADGRLTEETSRRAGTSAIPTRRRRPRSSASPGEITMVDLARALRPPRRPRAGSGGRRGGAPRLPRAVPARRGELDRGGAPAGAHGHRQGAPRVALAPAARRRRDAARDGRRGDRYAVTSVTGTPKRRWASPTTSSSR
jgi:hypothetical protein